MSTRRELEKNTSISSGDSSTSVTLELDDNLTTTLLFDGDSDSSNLEVLVQARFDDSESWSRFDKLDSFDLTETDNNSKIIPYDTLDLENLRTKITNNGASSTTVSVIASKTLHQ